jgi:hypothetical protein
MGAYAAQGRHAFREDNMNTDHRPVRTTLLLGGLGGLVCCLAGWTGAWPVFRPWFSFGIVWCLIAVYALVLLRWSGRSLPAVFFPLLVLAGVGAAMPTAGLAFGLALAIFSWIRSGICYPRSVAQSLVREAVLCGGGGLCLMLWGPSTPLSWGLGIWLFCVVQALFFILFEPGLSSSETLPPDHFDQALRRIEALLDGH